MKGAGSCRGGGLPFGAATWQRVKVGTLAGLVVLAVAAPAAHAMIVTSSPLAAQVYVGAADSPAGVTPLNVPDTTETIRVVHGGKELAFRADVRTNAAEACGAGCLGCVAGVGVVGCTMLGVYGVAVTLAGLMPVLAPIIAVCGAPPAAIGQGFWSLVGGLVGCGLAIPCASLSAANERGPNEVHVDLDAHTVTSTPANQAREVAPAAATPAAPPSDQAEQPLVVMRY